MRRRSLILENKIIKSETSGFYIGNHGRFTNQIFSNNIEMTESFEPLKKNRFIVDLEIDSKSLSKKIPNSRIGGFRFNSDNSGKSIDIDIVMTINDWVEDFLKVNICKVYLIDATGRILRMFDYDVVNSGYKYDVSYNSSDVLKPRFFYKII
jgi:hypothetical protein|tara:strand:- start:62 stop:517 length:456 start_codon:yes stop_codon:yes gene_type:complete